MGFFGGIEDITILRFSDLYQMLMIILDDNLIFKIFFQVITKSWLLMLKSEEVDMPFKPKCQVLIYNPKLALIGAYD